MKKIAVWAIVILVFLSIFAAILFKAFHSTPSKTNTTSTTQLVSLTNPSTSASETPVSVTTSCYAWYIGASINDTQTTDPQAFSQGAQSCFTGDFMGRWDALIEASGVNPVVLAQDYPSSWFTHQVGSIYAQNDMQADVLLTLGTGDQTARLLVHLMKTPNGWRISGVDEAP